MEYNMSEVNNSAPAANTPATQSEAPASPELESEAEEAAVDSGQPDQNAEKDATADAEAAKAKVEEKKNNKKKYKIKVDKNEEEIEFDSDNEEEVKKHLQKSRASDKRFQEAAEVRKAAMQFIEELKKNPRKVLSDPNINVDLKKFAEEIINEHIQELEKSPEQREREQLTQELERLKNEAKDREENLKKSEFERLQAQQERELTTQIESALDVGGIPKHPRTVKAMAEMMIIALQNDIDLTPQDIAPIIKNNTMTEFKEIIQALSDDQLEDFLGKEILGRLTKKRVAKAKSAVQSANTIKATAEKPKQTGKEDKKMTIRDFLKV